MHASAPPSNGGSPSVIVIFPDLLPSPDIHPSPGEQPIVSPMDFFNHNYYYKGRERERERGIPYKKAATGGTSVKGAWAWARRGIPGLGLGLARLGWFGVALVGIQSLLSIRFTWKGTAAQRPRQKNMRFFFVSQHLSQAGGVLYSAGLRQSI